MTTTAREYARLNADKAKAAASAAREREDAHAAAYWQGYAVALEALLDHIDRRVLSGLY